MIPLLSFDLQHIYQKAALKKIPLHYPQTFNSI